MDKKSIKRNKEHEANLILKSLESKGFRIKDINRGNGYFIFDFGEDSVVNFSIKGLKGWKFGMWLRDDEDIFIFTQHTLNIDKFKPSCSSLVVRVNWESLYNPEENLSCDYGVLSELFKMCKYIKYHPIVAYLDDADEGDFQDIRFWLFAYIRSVCRNVYHQHIKQALGRIDGLLWGNLCKIVYRFDKEIAKATLVDNCKEWGSRFCSPMFNLILEPSEGLIKKWGLEPNSHYPISGKQTLGDSLAEMYSKHNGFAEIFYRREG